MNLKIYIKKTWLVLALVCLSGLSSGCDKVSGYEEYETLIWGTWYCDEEYVDGIRMTAENSGDNFQYYDLITYTFVAPNNFIGTLNGTASESYAFEMMLLHNFIYFAMGDYVYHVEILKLTEDELVLTSIDADLEVRVQYFTRVS